MYIKNFHIEEFGPLKNFTVEDIPCSIAIFLGKNEAGKSSAMEFIRTMLMGIPSKRNILTQNIRNSKGGRMRIHDGLHGDIDIIKNFIDYPNQTQLFDANGNKCKEHILTDMYGGVTRDVYRMIFGFNLLELQNIGSFHGSEIFNSLLGASFGLGLRGPVLALEQIQEKMDLLYKSRGKNSGLQKLFDKWNNNKNALDLAHEEVLQFENLQKKRRAFEEELAELKHKKSDYINHSKELQILLAAYPQWEKWAELQDQLLHLPSVNISFPQNAEVVLERILEQKKIQEKNIEGFQIKLEDLQNKIKNIRFDNFLLEQKQSILDLMEEKGAYRNASKEYTILSVKKEQYLPTLAKAAANVKLRWILLDGNNSERQNLTNQGLEIFLEKIPHDEAFLKDFGKHEASILEAESFVQSAKTALEYAQKDIKNAVAKREQLEQQKVEKEQNESPNNAQSDSFLGSVAHFESLIQEVKELFTTLPQKQQRVLTLLNDWKKYIGNLELLPFEDSSFQIEQNSEISQKIESILFLSDEDKQYFIKAVALTHTIKDNQEEIIRLSQKYLDAEQTTNEIYEQLKKTEAQLLELGIEEEQDPQILQRELQEDKVISDSIELHSRALQKLNTIDELRTQSLARLKALHAEKSNAEKNIEESNISSLAYFPGVAGIGVSSMLMTIRLLGGEDLLLMASLQDTLFAFMASFVTTLFIPYWLPIGLFCLSIFSIFLPFYKSSSLKSNVSRFYEIHNAMTKSIENLLALKLEENSVISISFNINEEEQNSFYHEKIQKMLVAKKQQGEDLDLLELSQGNTLSLESFSNQTYPLEDYLSDPQNAHAEHEIETLIQEVELYQELASALRNSLKEKRDAEYEELEEREKNRQQIQYSSEEKQLLNQKQIYEKLYTEHLAHLQQLATEREEYLIEASIKPEISAKQIATFFLRIDACLNTEKKFFQLFEECQQDYTVIDEVKFFAKKYFAEPFKGILAQTQTGIQEFSQFLDSLQEHVQQRKALSVENTASTTEKEIESALHAEEQAKKHAERVKEDLNQRQTKLEAAFDACVDFLCQKGYLDSKNFHDYYERMAKEDLSSYQNEDGLTSTKEQTAEPDNSLKTQDKEGKQDKKFDTKLLKNLLEYINIFKNARVEYKDIQNDLAQVKNIIAKFEATLKVIIRAADYKPKLQILGSDVKTNPLDDFTHLHNALLKEIEKNRQKEVLGKNLSDIEQQKLEVQADLTEISENLNALFHLANVQTEEELRSLITFQKQKEQIVQNSLAIEEAFKNTDVPEYLTQHKKIVEDTSKPEKEPENPKPSIFEYFSKGMNKIWQEEIEGLKHACDSIEEKETELQNNCGALSEKCENLAASLSLDALRQEQLDIEEKIEDTYQEWLELSLAKQIITKARKQYEQNRQPKVIALASEYFAAITDNAWEQIYVSLDDRDIKILDKGGIPLNPEILSQGTKEQLYLALRLAHIKIRAQSHQPLPILMDDILVNFDNERMENTVGILKKIVEENPFNTHIANDSNKEYSCHGQQILYYTCHEKTAEILQKHIKDTKVYLVENKQVRALA